MTIDKAVDRLEDLHFEQDDWEYGELTDDCLLNREALRLSIKTMRKYQKIEQIIRNYDTAWEFHTLRDTIDKIREVIEDENDNQHINGN